MFIWDLPGAASGKEPACQCRRHWQGFDPWVGRAPGEGHGNSFQYSCWRIPWTKEPVRLQSTGSQRVGHDWSNLAWHIYIYIYIYIYICLIDIHTYTYIHIYVSNFAKLWFYICIYMYLYIFIREGNGNPFQHSCWRIPWTEEPVRLQSMGSQRVGQDWSNLAWHIYIYIYIFIYICVCLIDIHTYIYMYLTLLNWFYICIYMYLYIFIYVTHNVRHIAGFVSWRKRSSLSDSLK